MKSSKNFVKEIYDESSSFTEAQAEAVNNFVDKYTHDQLLKSLYWIWDGFDRAMMGMFLVYGTAESVLKHMLLEGEAVHVGVRKSEYLSGSKPILLAFAGNPEEKQGYDVYKCPLSEAPVFVHYFDEDECIKSTDLVQYQHEFFRLPNPYSKFIELWPQK